MKDMRTGRQRSSTIVGFSALMVVLFSLSACKHEPPVLPEIIGGTGGTGGGTGGGEEEVVCDSNVVWFQQEVLPILVSSCAIPGCHNAGTAEEGIIMESYSSIMSSGVVEPGDPFDSELIEVVTESDPDDIMPPPPHEPLTPAQINTIVTWIQQGAQNNSCVGGCDTTNVTYSGRIAPMLANKCNGCHSGSTPQGGLNFTSWSTVNLVALDGRLSGAVQHQSGYAAMPPSGAQLSQCEIDRILIWIADGAPNN